MPRKSRSFLTSRTETGRCLLVLSRCVRQRSLYLPLLISAWNLWKHLVSGIHSSRTLNLFLVSSLLKANLDNYFYLILVTTNFLINPLAAIMTFNMNIFYDLFSTILLDQIKYECLQWQSISDGAMPCLTTRCRFLFPFDVYPFVLLGDEAIK